MSIFSGLSNYIVPAANSLAGYNAGAESEKDKTLKNALTMYQMKRQQEQDAMTKSLQQSTIAKNAAMAGGKFTYKQGPDGEWYALPTNAAGMPKADAEAPAVPPVASPVQSAAPTQSPDLSQQPDHVPEPPQQGGQTAPAKQPNRLGLPSGVVGRVPPPPRVAPDPVAVHAANRDYDVKHPLPQTPPGNILVTSVDAQGKPTILAGKSKGDIDLRDTGFGKPATGGMGGGQSLAPEDRLKMLNQAKLDNETMKQFEAKVLAGQANVGMGSGVAGSLAGGHGTGVLPGVLAAVGNTATGAINPEYQKYLTAQRSYGRIMGNLQSKRYSDNQAEIERSISGLGANDLPSTIQYKQALRDASLADPVIMPPGGGRGGGGAPASVAPPKGAATPATPGTHEVTIGGRTYRVPD